jgi:hypothetical protein
MSDPAPIGPVASCDRIRVERVIVSGDPSECGDIRLCDRASWGLDLLPGLQVLKVQIRNL